MKKELLLEMVPKVIEELLGENYNDILSDMDRTFMAGDTGKSFKFPVSISLVLKPAGETSRFEVDMSWSVKKKIKSGDYLMDETKQMAMFKDNNIEGSDEPREVSIGYPLELNAGDLVEAVDAHDEIGEIFKKKETVFGPTVYPDWVILKKNGTPNFKRHSLEELVEFFGLYKKHFFQGSVRSTMKYEDLITAMEVNYIGWPAIETEVAPEIEMDEVVDEFIEEDLNPPLQGEDGEPSEPEQDDSVAPKFDTPEAQKAYDDFING